MKKIAWLYCINALITQKICADIAIYNHTDHPITARFYYDSVLANSEFTIQPHDSKESAIPSIKIGKRRNLIASCNNQNIQIGPFDEWFSNKIIHIVLEYNRLTSYTQNDWDRLSESVKKNYEKKQSPSFFSSPQQQELPLEQKIPEGEKKKDWTMIINPTDQTYHLAFYYKGTLSKKLKKASGPIYRVQKGYGYAQVPSQAFLTKGLTVAVYSTDVNDLVDVIKKIKLKSTTHSVSINSIIQLGPEEKSTEIKPRKYPLTIVSKTDYPLYAALYRPDTQSLIQLIKDYLKKDEKIKKYTCYIGPEKLSTQQAGVFEVSEDSVLVVSSNREALGQTLTDVSMQGMPYAPVANHQYLIIARPQNTVYIYTSDQWKEALDGSDASASGIFDKLFQWATNKIFKKQ